VNPDAIWDGEWGRSREGVLDGGGYHRRGMGSFDGEPGCPIVTDGDFVE